MTTIAETHAAYLPADRMLARGPASLSNGELLSLMLGADTPGEAVESAFHLLESHGTLRGLLDLQLPELVKRVGKDAACRIAGALELASRHLAEDLGRGVALTDPKATGTYFNAQLRSKPHEVFAAVFLDTRHRVIAYEELFNGTVDGAEVHQRVIVQRALQLNAAAMIVAHNHPSGDTEPSAADRAVTAQLKKALQLVDVRLLDHFVIGDGSPVSMAMRGWI